MASGPRQSCACWLAGKFFFLFFESSGKGLDSGPILDIRGAICVHAFVHACIELVN